MRAYASADGAAVIDLVVAAGMFGREEADFLADGVLDSEQEGASCWVADAEDGRGLASVLLYRPEESSDRGYDLTMIAVRPDLQGGGRGAALMQYAEDDLRGRARAAVARRPYLRGPAVRPHTGVLPRPWLHRAHPGTGAPDRRR